MAAVGYKQTMTRHWMGHYLLILLAPMLAAAQEPALRIRVLEGDGAINSIRFHRAKDPVVQVTDSSGEPIAGAIVTFLLPGTGPSGTFGESGLSLTVTTERDGRAAAHGLKPNRIEGPFRIRVAASAAGQNASAVLNQTNAEPVVQSKSGKKIAIIALIGAAAVGGAVAAAHGGKSSSTTTTDSTGTTASVPPGATIVPGTPTFGPPH